MNGSVAKRFSPGNPRIIPRTLSTGDIEKIHLTLGRLPAFYNITKYITIHNNYYIYSNNMKNNNKYKITLHACETKSQGHNTVRITLE